MGEIGGEIVKIGNAPDIPECLLNGRIRGDSSVFCNQDFLSGGKYSSEAPKICPGGGEKRLRITVIGFHNSGCIQRSRIIQKVTNAYNFWCQMLQKAQFLLRFLSNLTEIQ